MTTPGPTLVLCADAAYRVPLAVLVRSLATTQAAPLRIDVLSTGIGTGERERIDELAGPHTLRWHEPDLASLGRVRLPAHLPQAALFRLLAPELLDEAPDRLVYLDTDTIVAADLTPLVETDLDGHAVGAVQDAWIEVAGSEHGPPFAALGLAADAPYFNSGVLVVDVAAWREAEVADRCLALLRDHDLPYADQCALNVVLDGRWVPLHPRWNLQTAHGTAASHETDPDRLIAVAEALEDPGVIHFVGTKPWQRAGVVRGARWHAVHDELGALDRMPADARAEDGTVTVTDTVPVLDLRRAARGGRRVGGRLAKRVAARAGLELRRRGAPSASPKLDPAVVELVCTQTQGIVSAGPFTGMHLLREASWGGSGDLVAKLLGVYEQELAPVLEEIVATAPTTIVNLGCADGYYAIGMGRRLPDAQVIGVDIVVESLRIAEQAAARNGLGDRSRFLASVDDLPATAAGPGSAWLVDIEGAEELLLAPPWDAALAGTLLVIECHDFANPGVTGRLCRHFRATHAIEVVRQQGRDPNAIPLLRDVDEAQRWLAVNEGRPRPMHWLVLRPVAP